MKHYFSTEAAVQIGIVEALILEHIAFWVERNHEKGREPINGRWWMYESVQQMAVYFPYLTPRQVRSALENLVAQGAIYTGVFNKLGMDRTKWYTPTDRGWSLLQED